MIEEKKPPAGRVRRYRYCDRLVEVDDTGSLRVHPVGTGRGGLMKAPPALRERLTALGWNPDVKPDAAIKALQRRDAGDIDAVIQYAESLSGSGDTVAAPTEEAA